MSVSLFARATRFPASNAAHVPRNPAAPTMAATTMSTSSAEASRSIASGPNSNSVFGENASRSTVFCRSASATTAQRGSNRRLCDPNSSQLWLAEMPASCRLPDNDSKTSRQLVPMEPVDPRTAICFIHVRHGVKMVATVGSTLFLPQRNRRKRHNRSNLQRRSPFWSNSMTEGAYCSHFAYSAEPRSF